MVCDGVGFYCGALPIQLTVCPTCHGGIKPTRGFTWINLKAIRGSTICVKPSCDDCPINSITKAGLLWVGEKYYDTPATFNKEAAEMGISRRIAQIPRDFILGETWVALAHRKAITIIDAMDMMIGGGTGFKESPGIFHVFKPDRIEYIIKKGDSKAKLEALEKGGLTLIELETDEPDLDGIDEESELEEIEA